MSVDDCGSIRRMIKRLSTAVLWFFAAWSAAAMAAYVVGVPGWIAPVAALAAAAGTLWGPDWWARRAEGSASRAVVVGPMLES